MRRERGAHEEVVTVGIVTEQIEHGRIGMGNEGGSDPLSNAVQERDGSEQTDGEGD